MREGWEYRKLGEVATFTRGLTYSKNDEAEKSVNVVLRSNNVDLSNGTLNLSELKFLKPEFVIPQEKKVKKGSLLMCMSNGSKVHLGKVALIDKDYDYAFGGFMALVTPNKLLDPQFFFYSLSTSAYKDFIKNLSAGANINNIKVRDLELFSIPVPSISEQQRVVAYLDSSFAKIDEMKANAAKALSEAKALFQAELKKCMEKKEGWEYHNLEYAIDDLRTGLNPRVHFKLNTEGAKGYYITVRELKGWSFHVDDKTDRINEQAIKRIDERSKLKIGDVLYSGTGTIGNTALVQELPTWWGIKEGVYAITPKKEILDSSFLIYVLNSLKEHIISKTSGTTIKSIPMKELKKIIIPIPPLPTQQHIVTHLDSLSQKVQELERNYNTILAECDAMKQAILKEVFE